MYQYVSAMLQERGKNKRLVSVNISLMPLFEIFAKYVDGYIVVSSTLITGQLHIRLNELKAAALPFVNLPFEQWILYIGNRTLPYSSTAPVITQASVKYSDAFQSQYTIKRAHPTYAPGTVVPLGDRTDLFLSKTGVAPQTMYERLMVSVGGLWHITDTNPLGLRVKNGGVVADVGGHNTVGLMSFADIGKLTYVPIQVGMLGKELPTIPYRQELLINLNVDLTDKSLILVIGGYLHVNDVYEIVNREQGIVKVRVDKIQLLQRYYESKDIIDLLSLPIDIDVDNAGLVSIPAFFSDANLAAYFTLSQSFAVIVDTPSLYTERHLANKPNLPGIVEVSIPPIFPLMTTYGRTPEYWRTPIQEPFWEPNAYSLDIDDNRRPNYVFETYRWQASPVVDDQLVANCPYEYGIAHLFEIGKQQIVY